MGRHRTPDEKRELGEKARAMRGAGRSRQEIQEQLGIGDDLAKAFLRGVPLPDSLRRPRAKDGLRVTAQALRESGWTYDQIAAELGVSKSTCSLWLRDLPVPPSSRQGGDPAHMDMMRRRYWDRVLAERQQERTAAHQQHAVRIGRLSPRELELAAVVAYWCEGSKSKAWNRREQVTFINSDPGLVLLFLGWLDDIGFPQQHRRFTLSIHESADVAAAHSWWAATLDVEAERFSAPQLKRHNPRTVRKNVGDAYVGCVVVRLLQCRTLYQRIEGVWQGIVGGLPDGGRDDLSRVV